MLSDYPDEPNRYAERFSFCLEDHSEVMFLVFSSLGTIKGAYFAQPEYGAELDALSELSLNQALVQHF